MDLISSHPGQVLCPGVWVSKCSLCCLAWRKAGRETSEHWQLPGVLWTTVVALLQGIYQLPAKGLVASCSCRGGPRDSRRENFQKGASPTKRTGWPELHSRGSLYNSHGSSLRLSYPLVLWSMFFVGVGTWCWVERTNTGLSVRCAFSEFGHGPGP